MKILLGLIFCSIIAIVGATLNQNLMIGKSFIEIIGFNCIIIGVLSVGILVGYCIREPTYASNR